MNNQQITFLKDNNGEIVAYVNKKIKRGTIVRAAYNSCSESLNANRDCNLVNAFILTATSVKNFDTYSLSFAKQINVQSDSTDVKDYDEFLLV